MFLLKLTIFIYYPLKMYFNNFTLMLKKNLKKNNYKLVVVKLEQNRNLRKNNRVVETLGTISIHTNEFNLNIFRLIHWISLNISITESTLQKFRFFRLFEARAGGEGEKAVTEDNSTDFVSVAKNK